MKDADATLRYNPDGTVNVAHDGENDTVSYLTARGFNRQDIRSGGVLSQRRFTAVPDAGNIKRKV